MSTFNTTDLQQMRENLARVRRDKLSSPRIQPSGFVDTGGDTSAVPGDRAPFARVPPFATPYQPYGVAPVTLPPFDNVDVYRKDFPVLNVEGWRKATFLIQYALTGPINVPGQLGIVPFYGYAPTSSTENLDIDDTLVPRAVYDATLISEGSLGFAYRTLQLEEFRTPAGLTPNLVFPFRFALVLDVAEYFALTLSFRELSEAVTCDPELPENERSCSLLEVKYSLSM